MWSLTVWCYQAIMVKHGDWLLTKHWPAAYLVSLATPVVGAEELAGESVFAIANMPMLASKLVDVSWSAESDRQFEPHTISESISSIVRAYRELVTHFLACRFIHPWLITSSAKGRLEMKVRIRLEPRGLAKG